MDFLCILRAFARNLFIQTIMINQINESKLFEYHHGLMMFGPRYTGSINCTLAAEYIYNSFQQMGLNVEFHEWRYDGFESKNIVATLPGTDVKSTAEYILCGHYDTIPGHLVQMTMDQEQLRS
jgi:acetylornithine deacetylase/succinyl-diaminopimelate desuccinylase-like protein